jgi:hypothetical protein
MRAMGEKHLRKGRDSNPAHATCKAKIDYFLTNIKVVGIHATAKKRRGKNSLQS